MLIASSTRVVCFVIFFGGYCPLIHWKQMVACLISIKKHCFSQTVQSLEFLCYREKNAFAKDS